MVQDEVAYRKLLDRLGLLSAEETLQQRIASLEAGEPGVPASEVLADVQKQLAIKKER